MKEIKRNTEAHLSISAGSGAVFVLLVIFFALGLFLGWLIWA